MTKTLSFLDFKVGRSASRVLIEANRGETRFEPGLHLLIAPNGYGKSSFLQTLAGALPSLKGDVFLGDSVFRAAMDSYYVSEYLSFPKWIKPWEWVEFQSRERATHELKAKLSPWVKRLGLEAKMDSFLGRMSQGERRKVTWLCAHASGRPVLLLDEPLDGLDLFALEAVRDLLAAWKKEGRTVLVVAHQASEMLDLCDEYWVLKNRVWVSGSLEFKREARSLSATELRKQALAFYSMPSQSASSGGESA
jgi:ABC-type multidrug transport system ATPase subunit